MTGIMLEAVRKDFWKADNDTVRQIAKTHAELMKKFDLPPVRNEKLREMIEKNLSDPELKSAYRRQVKGAADFAKRRAEERKKAEEVSGQKLKKETADPAPRGDRGTAVKIIILIAGCVLAVLIIGSRRRMKLR